MKRLKTQLKRMRSIFQLTASTELSKQGVFVSGSGVRSIWLRHNLENFKKRLKALEAQVAEKGIILTDAQIAALEIPKGIKGKMCNGRTPMDTLLDGKRIWAQKNLNQI